MDSLFDLKPLDELDEADLTPIEYSYPDAKAPPASPSPLNNALTDTAALGIDWLRTNVGNQLGPIPQQQLNQLTPSQLRALKNQRFEEAAGWGKPLAQFVNAVTSPAVSEGAILGIPNALMKLADFVVDPEGALPGDVPQIPKNALAPFNPARRGDVVNTPADDAGYVIGAEVAGEVAGALTGSTLMRRVPQVASLTNRLRQTQTARRIAVAAKTSQTKRRALNLTRWGGEAMIDTSLAALYQDADEGNVLDLLPFETAISTSKDNTYGQNLLNKVVADGILLPLTLIGAGQLAPWTRRLADGDLAWGLDEIAEVELAPYVPRSFTQPQLPPASSVDQQFDSAIDRTTSAQLQGQQVAQQQERINTMFPGLRQLNSDQLAIDITSVGGTGTGNKLSKVETPEGEVVPGGPEFEFKQRPKQGALDLGEFGDAPDPRPEISTYLAELDELDDAGLRRVLGNVDQTEQISLRQQSLEEAQARVTAAEAKIADVEERLALPEGSKRKLTEQGSKRLLNKAYKELEAARLQVSNQSAEPFTAASVGDQLAMELQQSLDLSATPDVQLPSLEKFEFDEATGMWRTKKADGGYPSLEAYREDISGWNRDLLRGMASPENSPQIAALVKARTGRRVWAAKKQDIVDALVEYAGRTKRYAVDSTEQLPLEGLQQNLDLATEPTFQRRGMSAAERELMKKKILQAAIDAGEVQADITPPPAGLPQIQFNQGELIESLFNADASGQLDLLKGYADGEIPTYKAGGKNAEALIEEVRSRFDWAELDGAGQVASKKAMWEKEGWNKLTWDERKRLMMLNREETGLYRAVAGEKVPQLARANPNEVSAQLLESGRTEVNTQLLEWTPEGNVPVTNSKFPEFKAGRKLFHGTSKEAAAAIRAGGFKIPAKGKGRARVPGDLGDGVYFSPSRQGASAYGDAVVINKATGESRFESNFIEGTVPAGARILDYNGTPKDLAKELKVSPARLQQKLKSQGYDGLSARAAGSTTDEAEIVIWNQDVLDQISGTKSPVPKSRSRRKSKNTKTPDQVKVDQTNKRIDDKVRRLEKQLEEATCNG
jgi:hypothetical protein